MEVLACLPLAAPSSDCSTEAKRKESQLKGLDFWKRLTKTDPLGVIINGSSFETFWISNVQNEEMPSCLIVSDEL